MVDHLRWDLKAISKLAVEDGHVRRNPAGSLATEKAASEGTKRAMEKGDVVKAIGALELRERLIFKLATFCGMRPGEIFGLTWADVHDNHLEVVRRVYRGDVDSPPKTRRSIRKVALPTGVAADLTEWKSTAQSTAEDGWVFASEKATQLSRDNVWRRNIQPALVNVELG